MLTKVCSYCNKEKPLTDFYPQLKGKYGRYSRCKICMNKISNIYKKQHREELNAKAKIYRESHATQVRMAQRRWKQSNKNHIKVYDKAHRKEKADAIRHKRRTDPKFRLNSHISSRIWHALRNSKDGSSWEVLVGYTLKDLIKHLESKFQTGMTWENYGDWHIDHIIPMKAFNFEKPQDIDFKRCWALSNLRPVWRSENCAKQAMLKSPFQPSFIFNTSQAVDGR